MKHCKPTIQASLLLTGNEILNGDIVDTNSNYIAKQLLETGIAVRKKVVVGDDLDDLVSSIQELGEESEIVIVTGGLGSTIDDLTAEAASIVINRPLIENPLAMENIKKRYGRSFKDDNTDYFAHLRKQAMLPEGVEILPNPVGLAVGFKIKVGKADFYFTPGVPKEMKTMITQSIIPDITKRFELIPTLKTNRFNIIGTGESRIQQIINQNFSKEVWQQIELGFRASIATVEVKLSIRDKKDLALLEETSVKLKRIFQDQVASYGETLHDNLVKLIQSKEGSLVIIENSTFGYLTKQIGSFADQLSLPVASFSCNQSSMLKELLGVDTQVNADPKSPPTKEQNELVALQVLEKSGFKYCMVTSPVSEEVDSESGQNWRLLIITCGTKDKLVSRELAIKRDWEELSIFAGIATMDLLRRLILDYPLQVPYYFDELTRHLLK